MWAVAACVDSLRGALSMGKALRLSLPVFTRSTGRRRVYVCVYVRGPFMYWSMFNCLVGPSTRAGTGRGRIGRG